MSEMLTDDEPEPVPMTMVIEVELDPGCRRNEGRLLEYILALPHVASVVELEYDHMGGYERMECTRMRVTHQ